MLLVHFLPVKWFLSLCTTKSIANVLLQVRRRRILVDILVVQEQVIVQAFPVVVGSLPPAEQFTGPLNNQAHHEQFAAGETTEKSAEFPAVQEQVIVQASVGLA